MLSPLRIAVTRPGSGRPDEFTAGDRSPGPVFTVDSSTSADAGTDFNRACVPRPSPSAPTARSSGLGWWLDWWQTDISGDHHAPVVVGEPALPAAHCADGGQPQIGDRPESAIKQVLPAIRDDHVGVMDGDDGCGQC